VNTDNCIVIWAHQYDTKSDIINNRILNKIKCNTHRVFARKTVVKELDSLTANTFLECNHIQGKVNAKYRYGLFFNNKLVSVMTFGKLRKNLGSKNTCNDNTFELLRFCSKLDCNVIGGASKLFKHFIKAIEPKTVISYCDKQWAGNNPVETVYSKALNMQYVHDTGSNYYWACGDVVKNRFTCRKDVLVSNGFDANMTEVEIMHSIGAYRIFDAGSMLFKWHKNQSQDTTTTN
jgi:hypothetical protein